MKKNNQSSVFSASGGCMYDLARGENTRVKEDGEVMS